jgi:hypothetical protein
LKANGNDKNKMVWISSKRLAFLIVITLFSMVLFINEISFVVAGNVGYELLDNNKVLHIWNTEDDYYFNATSGMQFTNHYQEYWSKNYFCGGYYLFGSWNKLICVDELPFAWSINTDDATYINITGYRDVSFSIFRVRFAVRYHLKDYDTRLSVIPYVKNLGPNIPYDLGFAWHIRNIQIDMQEENNTLTIYSDEGYPIELLNGLDQTYIPTNGYFNELGSKHSSFSSCKTIRQPIQFSCNSWLKDRNSFSWPGKKHSN